MRIRKCRIRPEGAPRRAGSRAMCEGLERRRLFTIVFGSAPTTTVSDNNGPIISRPQVELVFWGPAWGGAPGALSNQVAAAYSTIATSGYLSGLDEYRAAFGPGAIYGQAFVSDNTPPSSFTNSNVATMLQNEFAIGKLPQPTATSNLYYFVVPSSGTSSPNVAGEHTFGSVSGHIFHYGWTVNGANNVDSLTKIFSHELAEAASDPQGSALQVDPRNSSSWHEICDGTPASFDYRLNGVQVQSYVSTKYHAYIIPTGQRQDFFLSAVGGTLTINGDQLASTDDTITVDRTGTGGVAVTLNGETASFDSGQVGSIVINSGAGNDTINILATSLPITVNSSSASDGPSDQINLGKAGLTSGLTGRIAIGNSSGHDTLNIDDSADPMTRSVTLTSTGPQGTILNLTPGSVVYTSAQLDALNIRSANVLTLFAIRSLGVATNITASGPENVFVGNNGSVQAVVAPLNLDDTKPQMILTLDDSTDPVLRNIVLSTSMAGAWQDVSGLAPGLIRYDGAALNPTQRALINGGIGNDFTFCGDQRNQFPMNQLVSATFTPGTPCANIIQVSGM